MVWRARGRIPVAVDSTTNFIETLLTDQGVVPTRDSTINNSTEEDYQPFVSDMQKRMLYSLVFVR